MGWTPAMMPGKMPGNMDHILRLTDIMYARTLYSLDVAR